MGWYVDDNTTCPNCKEKKANQTHRGNESFYLVCPSCGLHLLAEYTAWVVTSSYIDKSVIGKDPENLYLEDIVDEKRNEDTIPAGTVL